MTRAEIDEWAEMSEIPLICADGFDEAIVGIGQQFNQHFVVYDYDKVIQTLVDRGMDYEDAVEHFEFNIVGAYVGEATPCFVQTRSEW